VAIGFGLAAESITVPLPAAINCGSTFCDEAVGMFGEVTIVCALAGSVTNNNKANAMGAPTLDKRRLWTNII
jgi:hypothetical protein